MAKNTRSNVYEGGLSVDPTVGAGVPATIGAILPRVGTTELWTKFGAGDTQWQLNTVATDFPPTRIAVVDNNRGNDATGAFGGLPFLTITAALAAAPAQNPVAANPVALWISPGTYAEALTFVSNCHLSTCPGTRGTVTINGTSTWVPAQGPNVPQALLHEVLAFSGIVFSQTLTINPSLKGIIGQTNFDVRACTTAALTITNRAGGGDFSEFHDSTVGQTNVTDGSATLVGCAIVGLGAFGGALVAVTASPSTGGGGTVDTTGNCHIIFNQSNIFTAINVGTGTIFETTACKVTGIVSVAGTGIFTGTACKFTNNIISGSANAFVDVRGSEWAPEARLIGPGPIDRSLCRFTFGPAAAGANALVFAGLAPPVPDFLDSTYSVTFTSIALGHVPVLNAKAATGLTFTDGQGGDTFEICILKE